MIDSERNYYPVFHTQAQVLQDNRSLAVIMLLSLVDNKTRWEPQTKM